ncbi:unnamed protein product [Cuscuta epithymum]|uniref:Sister chromatid cohesion 1 protein 3 n=1 Tax=Cuscuta epithymum TaxID=186058 RepID=A0AAV0CWQ1_9ASTE|nr:unnamed protein product [Cuscuta epithymum]
MFYAHTLLARKGPLGTVWCAAHLNYSLKKSDYTRTNIPSTVQFIMYPEVPIALRMSGHLLLGIVRIYSKQVDYFYQECNHLELRIRKAFACSNVNLPASATQAQYNSITLPETLQLDALETYDDQHPERSVDTHFKCPEEITLEDQIPTGREEYVAIYIDGEEIGNNSPREDINATSGLRTTPEKDSHHSGAERTTPAGQQQTPPNQTIRTGLNETTPQYGFHETERMRDASHNINTPITPLYWSKNREDDVLEPDFSIVEQVEKDNANLTPIVEEVLPSGEPFFPSSSHGKHPFSSSGDGHENIDFHVPFNNESPGLAIRSTPPPSPPPPPPPPPPPHEQPRPTNRRRRAIMDNTLVLSNQFMNAAMNDTSDLIRRRKEAPHSSLSIWRSNKRLKKDAMFFEPLITGQCEDLSSMHEHDFVIAKAHISSTEEVTRDDDHGVQPPPSHGHHDDMEVEHIRDNEGPTGDIFHEVLPMENTFFSPTSVPSTSRQEDFTPAPASLGSEPDQVGKIPESGVVLPTPVQASPAGNLHLDKNTPATFMEQDVQFEVGPVSDIPVFDQCAGDLSFLEEDENFPSASHGTPEVDSSGKQKGTSEFDALSTRTRAVAEYLKGQSSATPGLKGQSSSTPVSGNGDLSLSAVLEGKSRKLCARMFYETLVLKDCGLIEVNQKEPYGDVTLKATSKLLKEQL